MVGRKAGSGSGWLKVKLALLCHHILSQEETRHTEKRSVDTWLPTESWSLGYAVHVCLLAGQEPGWLAGGEG